MQQMSTDGTHGSGPGATEPATPDAAPVQPTSAEYIGDQPAPTPDDEHESWFSRHLALLVAGMVAVVVAAAAIAGLFLYRGQVDDKNTETEAAVSRLVSGQGAEVETIECDGDTCAAVIGGQAYSVLVQKDGDGELHFGVAPYAGD
jgi:hypothetical protein